VTGCVTGFSAATQATEGTNPTFAERSRYYVPLAGRSGLLSDRRNDGFNFACRGQPEHVIVGQVDKSGRHFPLVPSDGDGTPRDLHKR